MHFDSRRCVWPGGGEFGNKMECRREGREREAEGKVKVNAQARMLATALGASAELGDAVQVQVDV